MSIHHKSKENFLGIDGVDLDEIDNLRKFDKIVSERFGMICGIDEAGRGPIAGPVYAAAVILDPENPIDGLDDSKKLTPKKRELLYKEILDKALAVGVAYSTAEEIEKTDILTADLSAMSRAFEQLGISPKIVLVDGDVLPELPKNYAGMLKNVVGGDRKSEAVAAASIIAKVTRDREMVKFADKYPMYGFEKHKGYGTKAHYEAIDKYGACPIHRASFLKKYYAKKKKDENTKSEKG